ncbi:aquaporin-4-like [Diaphorina citri]|uniref:Aquaporin-4-like n=1 Tax=Diaphorina citri TaxID=121845 RepID=A0A1S4EM19_DIACI|nr:aquaporin-4-like [Diaphorina citri]
MLLCETFHYSHFQIFGHISGSHINPALSLVGVVMGKISLQIFVVYTIAQCIGATLGYSIARIFVVYTIAQCIGATLGYSIARMWFHFIIFPFQAQFAGCSINPARSFGPALVTGHWENHWVYWVAPLSGAFVGSFIYRVLFYDNPDKHNTVTYDTNESVKLQTVDEA